MLGWSRAARVRASLLEAGQPLGVASEVRGQDLEGHLATEGGVLGPVDLSHAAFSELGGDPVVAQASGRSSLWAPGRLAHSTHNPDRRAWDPDA